MKRTRGFPPSARLSRKLSCATSRGRAHGLPFLLLSDPELTAIQAYGVWQEKKNYGKVSMGVVRSTFIIGSDGMIEKVMPKVKPDTNAADVLSYLQANP